MGGRGRGRERRRRHWRHGRGRWNSSFTDLAKVLPFYGRRPSRKRRRKYLALSITTRTARARIRLRRRDSFSPPPFKDGNSGTTTHTRKTSIYSFQLVLFFCKKRFFARLSCHRMRKTQQRTDRAGDRCLGEISGNQLTRPSAAKESPIIVKITAELGRKLVLVCQFFAL